MFFFIKHKTIDQMIYHGHVTRQAVVTCDLFYNLNLQYIIQSM
jgi:hypothetical protein